MTDQINEMNEQVPTPEQVLVEMRENMVPKEEEHTSELQSLAGSRMPSSA